MVRLEAVVLELEPGVFDAAGAARLVEVFAAGSGSAPRERHWRRVASTRPECGTAEGARTGAHWLASKTGATIGDAERVLRTARALTDLPATEAALRSGELSATQSSEIAETASGSPEHESELLAAAAGTSVKVLRDECRRVRAASVADDAGVGGRVSSP